MKIKKPYHRYYKGVFYWYDKFTNNWYCELHAIPEENPFKTQGSVKRYISDYRDNTNYENN